MNFTSRNVVIRQADDMARKINKEFPRVSSTLLDGSPNLYKFQKLIKNINAKVRSLRIMQESMIGPYSTYQDGAGIMMSTIKTARTGNCAEAAYLASIFAKTNGIKNCSIVDLYTQTGRDLDHAVLLVKDKKPYIIDAWLGFADFVPKAFERYNKEYRRYFDLRNHKYNKMRLNDGSSTFSHVFEQEPTAQEIKNLREHFPQIIIKKQIPELKGRPTLKKDNNFWGRILDSMQNIINGK